MTIITYRVILLEPTLVTSLQGDPNSGVAFDYLPGSVLRGAFIGKYLGSKSADTGKNTLRRLFFDGTTRYLNGYPLDVYHHPSAPTPLSWQHEKDEEGEIFDFAIEEQDDKQQWQRVSAPFYARSGEDVRLIQPTRNIAVHTQRTARYGRAMPKYRPADRSKATGGATILLEEGEIPGAVYRYDALAAEQAFQASIICDNDDDAQTLRTFIDGYVTLGGSRSGGYGRAEIKLMDENVSDEDEPEYAEDVLEGKLIVTLQSNVLLRDARGQFAVDPELLRQVLGRCLGVNLKLEGAFLDADAIGGFNRQWGLPLPQALSMRMGSVLVFKDPGCDYAQLHDLETRGIGERRTEGFGRIAFNQQRTAQFKTTENTRKRHDLYDTTINDKEARSLARLMVQRMLKQRLDEALLHAANAITIINPPSKAQLSRLRGIVLEGLRQTPPDIGNIRQFIDSIEKRGSDRRQFERSTVGGTFLLRWLKDLLNRDSEGVWTMDENEWKNRLGVNSGEIRIGIGEVKAETHDSLRLEYVLRFIDLVLAHAAKQRGEED